MSVDVRGRIVQPTPDTIREAAEIIRDGGLVAFPTETVYGLGANALSPEAVRKIFLAKGRPGDNPLIMHVGSISDAAKYAEINHAAETLMLNFWPGPLTIVLASYPNVPRETRAGLDTVGIRFPLNTVAMELIRAAGVPIAAPSANRSGRPSPTTAQAVFDDLGDNIDLIIDGGETNVGLESTVVDATADAVAILRPGGVTREMLAPFVDVMEDEHDELKFRSPGTHHRHYAPSVPVWLWGGGVPDEALSEAVMGRKWSYVGMSDFPCDISEPIEKILFESVPEYGHGLFAALRALEKGGADTIVAQLPPNTGLGCAVCDRLRRAAGVA
ncbi:threonylcarbamoyl-AMP synthase [Synergistaceae bacterium OttesenSCG-928-I11]|nr:threonylcarbamoyl-AMP synthase [Synergistaceae bacterium OttesenSCG-928-I11]